MGLAKLTTALGETETGPDVPGYSTAKDPFHIMVAVSKQIQYCTLYGTVSGLTQNNARISIGRIARGWSLSD